MIYKIAIVLILISSAVTRAQLYVSPGTTLLVRSGTSVYIDSLVLSPVSDLTISDNTLTHYNSAASVSGGQTIARVYQWNRPLAFDGAAGIYYANAELNGNNAASLRIAYKSGSSWMISSPSTSTGNFVSSNFGITTMIYQFSAHSVNVPLPIILSDFTAAKNGSQIRLDWKVARETGLFKYTIERMADGGAFTKILSVMANGSTSYTAYDLSPATAKNYYRIVAHRSDGTQSTSVIRMVYFQMANAPCILIYPLPAQEILHIAFSTLPKKGRLTLFNTAGQAVREMACDQLDATLDIRELNFGMYLLRYMDSQRTVEWKVEKNR